jgi:hypothetical protein
MAALQLRSVSRLIMWNGHHSANSDLVLRFWFSPSYPFKSEAVTFIHIAGASWPITCSLTYKEHTERVDLSSIKTTPQKENETWQK